MSYLLSATVYAQLPEASSEIEENGAGSDRTQSERRAWRTSIDFGNQLLGVPDLSELVKVPFEDLPNTIKSQMDNSLGWVLQEDVHPHIRTYPLKPRVESELVVRVFAASDDSQDDVVKYNWSLNDKELRVTAGRNAMRFAFDLRELPACRVDRTCACVLAASEWLGEVLKLKGEYTILGRQTIYSVDLPWPEELRDGSSFSSAPKQDIVRLPTTPRYFARVDVIVDGSILNVILYKKIGQLMGYPEGADWFSEEFCTRLHERQSRELDRE